MNPWNPCDDLYFQISSSSADYSSLPIIQTSSSAAEDHHHHQILVNEYEYDPAIVEASASVPPCPNQKGKGKGKQRKELTTPNNNSLGAEEDGVENKKWMHREIEKQRRQEMARLCTTFRTLLPFEYIKGKRSTSDHMHEGVKYIKHLQNRVEQLQAKRDELVKLTNLRPKSGSSSSSTQHVHHHHHHHHHQTFVIVEPFSGGVLIKCSYSFRNYAFPLSGILDIVLRQGLNVVDCTSITTDDHRFIHTIRSEDPQVMTTETYYTELQRKLKEAISSSSLEESV